MDGTPAKGGLQAGWPPMPQAGAVVVVAMASPCTLERANAAKVRTLKKTIPAETEVQIRFCRPAASGDRKPFATGAHKPYHTSFNAAPDNGNIQSRRAYECASKSYMTPVAPLQQYSGKTIDICPPRRHVHIVTARMKKNKTRITLHVIMG